jgi:hypothetical protein
VLPDEEPGSGFLGGGPSVEHNTWTNVYEFKIDFSKMLGRHTFKTGADLATNPYERQEFFAESD